MPAGERAGVLIGKDTRISGYMLESALEAGLTAAGVDVYLAGPMPTPAVAYLTRALRLQAGVVISRFAQSVRGQRHQVLLRARHQAAGCGRAGHRGAHWTSRCDQRHSAELGKARRIDDAAGRYIEFCKSTFPTELDLRGLKIVVDCAHGATYHIARHVFHELGADVIASAPSRTARISTTAAARPPAGLRRRCWNTTRISALRWTATATG